MKTLPEKIYHWRDSQLSIARFYGGIRYEGTMYFIDPTQEGEPLVREDVLKREKREKKKTAKQERVRERDAFEASVTDLFNG